VATIDIRIPTTTMTTAISIRVNPDRFVNFENNDLDEIIFFTVFTFNGFVCSTHKHRQWKIKYSETYCILYEKKANVNANQKNKVFAGDVLKLLRMRFDFSGVVGFYKFLNNLDIFIVCSKKADAGFIFTGFILF